jgi:VWFA-related protein
MMTLSTLPLALALTLAAPLGSTSQPQRETRDVRTRDVYVSVVDAKGAPVSGLAAADFTVREDGVAREVLKAGPATAPLQIALVVDDSQAATQAIQEIREGLIATVDKMQGRAEISLVTVGERPTSLVDYTTDAAALKTAIGRIFSRPGSGAYLSEGILDVSKGLQKRGAARPVIVALTFDGVEYSNQQYTMVLDQLFASGAALHVLEVGIPRATLNEEMRNRNLVIAEGTSRTGGRRDQLLSVTAIPDRFRQLADELLALYVVTYARPDSLIPPERIAVGVNRPDLTARARTRVAAK